MKMNCNFTIAFICGGGYEYFHKILENNIRVLCDNTNESFDLVLFLDGFENYDYEPYIKLAQKHKFNEIILRSRKSNCANGDPSNNAHKHIFSTKTKYLITFESDVAIFKTEKNFDILKKIRETFEANKNIYLLTKIDDFDCWKEKLIFDSKDLCAGVHSVNRVSSHFLVYDTFRCEQVFKKNPDCFDNFYDTETKWYNYEDMLSNLFAKPKGPGIGFLHTFPIKVFHCDEKVHKDSVFYKKDAATKIRVFEKRKAETLNSELPYHFRSGKNE